MKHLYVMQAPSGRIKIGRSGNPEKRRSALEHQCGVPITLVMVFPERGCEELDIHYALAEHHTRLGEWFFGTQEAIAAIRAAIGEDITFPFSEPDPRPKRYGNRRVVRKMADGTMKEYLYPACYVVATVGRDLQPSEKDLDVSEAYSS
jgi:Meiotically up-regulated gene 113